MQMYTHLLCLWTHDFITMYPSTDVCIHKHVLGGHNCSHTGTCCIHCGGKEKPRNTYIHVCFIRLRDRPRYGYQTINDTLIHAFVLTYIDLQALTFPHTYPHRLLFTNPACWAQPHRNGPFQLYSHWPTWDTPFQTQMLMFRVDLQDGIHSFKVLFG